MSLSSDPDEGQHADTDQYSVPVDPMDEMQCEACQ